jgi:hypothetical protein
MPESLSGQTGRCIHLQSTNIPEDDLNLDICSRQTCFECGKGCIAEQLAVEYTACIRLRLWKPEKLNINIDGEQAVIPPNDLIYQNNLGGFSQDGKEYIYLFEKGGKHTSALEQYYSQQGFWISGDRIWLRLYLV